MNDDMKDDTSLPGDEFPVQDLRRFRMPPGFRGRSLVVVQLWNLVAATVFRCSPRRADGWRRFLLRLFGATVGAGVLIRPSARIVYPWKLRIGDYAWIGEDVTLYAFGPIDIGANAVVSQNSYLCAGTHDYRDPAFALEGHPITIGPECWVAADVFVGPGVSIGRGAVIGARSSVFSDLRPMTVAAGNPARAIRSRGAASGEGAVNP
jgi:putative colanic acid biosynthesis acetyltransferase WcaF